MCKRIQYNKSEGEICKTPHQRLFGKHLKTHRKPCHFFSSLFMREEIWPELTLPIILCSDWSAQDMVDLLWVQTLMLVNYKYHILEAEQHCPKQRRCPAAQRSCLILIQGTDNQSKERRCIQSKTAANYVFGFNINEATLVSKGNKADLNHIITGYSKTNRWELKAISQIDISNNSKRIYFPPQFEGRTVWFHRFL